MKAQMLFIRYENKNSEMSMYQIIPPFHLSINVIQEKIHIFQYLFLAEFDLTNTKKKKLGNVLGVFSCNYFTMSYNEKILL